MKPAPVDYASPTSLEEALELLTGEPEAKLLAGGQSLVPLLSLRLASPDLLVDLRRVDGLDEIAHAGDRVVVGAMVTQREAEHSHVLRELCPLVPDALRHVAHPQIRSRGTIGGSVAHADPAAELPGAALALDATVRVVGLAGAREIAAVDLFLGPLMTTIAEDEILTAIELPVAPPGSGDACVEVARRSGDYAMCGGVARVTVADGAFVDVRLALFGLAGVPARVSNVEEALRGGEASPEAIASATPAATDEIEIAGDDRVPEDYRRHLASVVARRTLGAALERSG